MYFAGTMVMTTGAKTGDADHNTKLSQRRADAVMADLVKRGINVTRLTARGYGDTMPRADNATPEGRATNRRTEFVVVGRVREGHFRTIAKISNERAIADRVLDELVFNRITERKERWP